MLLHGIFLPSPRPSILRARLFYEARIERRTLLETPAAGIVVQGSSGEAILLSDEERREVFKTARGAAARITKS